MNNFIDLEKMETIMGHGTTGYVVPYEYKKHYLPLPVLKKYFPRYEFFSNYFGEDIMLQALTRGPYGLDYFARQETVSVDTAWYFVKNGYLMADKNRKKYKKIETKGEWRKEVDEIGYTMWLISPYQGYNMYIREMFEVRYPWMTSFRDVLKIYSPDRLDDYIYIETGDNKKGCFYVKLRHLKDLNVKALIDAHIEYQTRYYHFPGGWRKDVTEEDVANWRSNHISATWAPETLRFLEYVELERLYRDNGKTDKIYY